MVGRFADSLPLSRLVRNFLYVIIDRRRTGTLPDVAEAFEIVLDERLGIVRADVKSATLNDRQQSDLQQELSRLSGKQVRCNFSYDPELIGGVVAQMVQRYTMARSARSLKLCASGWSPGKHLKQD